MSRTEDRVPVVWPVVAPPGCADAHRRGRAAAVRRAGGGGRGTQGDGAYFRRQIIRKPREVNA